ncbi:TIGR03621 family F420-dependent LLM class oxidoreductase [Bailinhaonella thermotolerans]|uniref:TIGR03621 family F420-dependent LLM class oxidoreductase n=1 Tax=Bailinhaonella thermotolerans TaxID=1070861 RepID=A0A3A4AHN6_9ACTN|nr:TIGR03621 family F420-dependent LLM class oxidoreductase [Bailinhaonella thermotolerans]RJL26474.1 TIGR03621 family F420-dependent LLM class oxidoreductase [Bailinhaonella thermotolerans]
MRRLRFGALVRGAGSAREWAEKARRLEGAGFATLLISDHLAGARFAPMPALVAAANATSRLRVGTLVLGNDFRNPVLLAKEAATVDLLSDGRLELGLGSGWQREDYEYSGVAQEPPGVRVDRLAEAIAVIKGVWSGRPFTYDGEHYRVRDAEVGPVPAQRPHPPLLIGGGGRRVLSLAASEADIVNVMIKTRPDGSGMDDSDTGLRELLAKLDLVRPGGAEIAVNVLQAGGDAPGSWGPLSLAAHADTPQVLLGGTRDMADKIRHWRDERGVSYFILHNENDLDAFIPVVEELAGR